MTEKKRRINPTTRDRARKLRRSQSPDEYRLWLRLRGRQLGGLRFRRQHPIGPYIVDFYCAEHRLIIELDGYSHGERADYDDRRTAWLEEQEYRVLRFTNEQVRANMDGVLVSVLMAAGLDPEV